MYSTSSPALAIVIPTHNRHDLLLATLNILFEQYSLIGFDVRVYCYDSSFNPCPLDRVSGKIYYTHVPGLSVGAKIQRARYDLHDIAKSGGWVLLSTDDDLFLPSVSLRAAIESCEDNLAPAIIPSRYLFFKKDAYREKYTRIVEQWRHHVHISKAELDPLNRLKHYASQGVASCWGFFNYIAFDKIANIYALGLEETGVLRQDCQGIIEDVLNLLILSFDWLRIDSHPICLRGEDRDFGANPGWRPSWQILSELQSRSEYYTSYKELKALLSSQLSSVICDEYLSDQLIDWLLSAHSHGYRMANSRLYAGSPALLLSAPEYRKSSVPQVSIVDQAKQYVEVVLPARLELINTSLYPTDSLLADRAALAIVYQYYEYMCMPRSRRVEVSS